MVRFTSEDLRRLADAIDNREKYGNFYRFEEVER